jgi:hypothetical protein
MLSLIQEILGPAHITCGIAPVCNEKVNGMSWPRNHSYLE